ncbi:MAG: Hpt domain-containing protein [Treponema sp.]|nr:Hpt domain-containing protein [Treponema sp.]
MSDKIIFDKETALDLLGRDEDLLQILIDSFLAENKFETAVLKKLVSDGKLGEAASYVHATKGAARQLCMGKLKDSGQVLEDVLRGKTTGDIPALIETMVANYAEAVAFLKGTL